MSVGAKLTVVIICMISLFLIVSGLFGFFSYRHALVQRYSGTALSVAESIADTPVEDIQIWQKLYNFYKACVMVVENGRVICTGTVLPPDIERTGCMTNVVPEYIRSVLEENKPLTTGLFSRNGRRIIAAFAPITGSGGEPIGVAGVMMQGGAAHSSILRFGAGILIFSAAQLLISVLVVLFIVRKNVGKPLSKLVVSLDSIAKGETDSFDLPKSGGREIRQMVYSLNSASSALDTLLHPVAGVIDDKSLSGNYKQVARGINMIMTVIDNIDALVYVTDFERNLLFANISFYNFFNAKPNKTPRVKCYEVKGRTEKCEFCQLQLLDTNTPGHTLKEREHYNATNNKFIMCEDSVIRWIDGSLVHMFFGTDITERKQLERERERERKQHQLEMLDSVDKIQNVMEAIDTLIYVVDPKYTIRYISKTAANAYKIDHRTAIGKKCYELLHQTNEPCRWCNITYDGHYTHSDAKHVAPPITKEQYEQHLNKWFSYRVVRTNWVDNKPVKIVSARDITGRKNADRRRQEQDEKLREAMVAAQESSRAKTTFLANMSHEIRTPMNGILGFAELAMDDGGLSAQTRDFLEKIRSSADGLLSVINDILDISKIEAGKLDLEQIPLDFNEIINSVQTLLEPMALDKRLAFSCYVEPIAGIKPIGDPMRFRQILINLAGNALKFTDKGSVEVSMKMLVRSDTSVTLKFTVKDTGIGLTETQLEQIFTPFTQGDQSTTRKYGGTGLGLPITKNLVELMGGKLEVTSTRGEGSEFTIIMPFSVATIEESEKLQRPAATFDAKPIFEGDVLVVEDNEINRQVIGEHLHRVGLNVYYAFNGREAVDMTYERMLNDEPQFDIILMDIQMPVMDGLKATELIFEMGCNAPVIALTANIMKNDVDAYLEAGMTSYLGKPFKSGELWACLMEILTPQKFIELIESDKHEMIATNDDADVCVNTKLGIQRFAGNSELYYSLLQSFVKNNAADTDKMLQFHANGDYKQAYAKAHSLKSVAATIGAEKLSALSEKAENTLRAAIEKDGGSYSPKAFNTAAENLKTEIKRVINEAEQIIGGIQTAKPEKTTEFDTIAALRLTDELIGHLAVGSTNSLSVMDELKQILQATSAPEGMAQLAANMITQIDEYDFQAAHEAAVAIRNKL